MTAELKKVKTHFLQAQPPSEVNIFTNSNEKKDLFIALSIIYIQISNTYLPDFLNMLL